MYRHIEKDEKKLTDEQIVKALECCAVEPCEDCGNCPRFTKEKLCHKANAKQSLDLINRQKAEIERLTEELDYFKKSSDYHEGNQKELEIKNAELQKQVDELNKVITDLKYTHLQDECKLADLISTCKRSLGLSDEWKAKFEQAVKDTAKEIYAQVLEWSPVGEDYHWFITTLENWLKEKYGVEVE